MGQRSLLPGGINLSYRLQHDVVQWRLLGKIQGALRKFGDSFVAVESKLSRYEWDSVGPMEHWNDLRLLLNIQYAKMGEQDH